MKTWLARLIEKLKAGASKWWFVPFVSFLAAADAYIFIVPNEAFLLPAILARPKKWFSVSLWITLGSAIGAASFSAFASLYGANFIQAIAPNLLSSRGWHDSEVFIQSHGKLGLALISVSPFPQHAAVALVGLAHMNVFEVLVAVFIGRGVKYVFLSWATVYSPQLLKRLRFTK